MNLQSPSQGGLLEEYKQVSVWTAVETEQAVGQRERLYAASPAGINRVRLALALGFGKGKAVDAKRASRLFDEVAKNPDDHTPDQRLFAEILLALLKERSQADARMGGVEAKLNAAEARAGTLGKQLESERSRADALAKKLDALMSIEKSLQKR